MFCASQGCPYIVAGPLDIVFSNGAMSDGQLYHLLPPESEIERIPIQRRYLVLRQKRLAETELPNAESCFKQCKAFCLDPYSRTDDSLRDLERLRIAGSSTEGVNSILSPAALMS